jgi:hypothetical protein
LLDVPRSVDSFADVLDFFSDEFAGLRRRRLPFFGVLLGTMDYIRFWHITLPFRNSHLPAFGWDFSRQLPVPRPRSTESWPEWARNTLNALRAASHRKNLALVASDKGRQVEIYILRGMVSERLASYSDAAIGILEKEAEWKKIL